MSNEIYEGVYKVDLNQFSDSNSLAFEYNKKKGSLLASLLANNGGIVSTRMRIFEERYSGGVLDMNIFCFAFINENENGNGSIIGGSSLNSNKLASRNQASNKQLSKIESGKINEGKVVTINDEKNFQEQNHFDSEE
jgi:hypothetical protein